MKTKFSKIVVLGLALMLAIVLAMPMAVQAKTLDWGTEDLPTVQTTFASGKAIQPLTDILGISAANDGKTIFAVVKAEAAHPNEAGAQEVWRTTNGGQSWWSKTPASGNITHVAVSPDDPSTVVAAGKVDSVLYAWISTDKGEIWSASVLTAQLSGTITSIAISEERDDIRWVAVGSDAAAKCLAVAKAEAFAGWDIAGATSGQWTGWNTTDSTAGVEAIVFSPWFNNDNTMLVVTVSGTETHLQAAEVGDTWATCYFNASNPSGDFASYPVEIGDDIVTTAASISLPETYYGYDAAERIAYIGTTVGATGGVYRMDDIESEKIKSGNLPNVAYDSAENQLLVGYASSGRVDMSSNPDSGSPTFTRPSSMKSPSGGSVSGVAWVGTTMLCSTKEITANAYLDDESAISVSDDARAWNQLSLIDTDLDEITDVAVSADGSKIYFVSQNSADSYYSVWRYASRWERVLCDDFASGQTGVIIRLAPEKPEVVFVGLLATKEIRRSTDSGDTWKQSRADIVMADMAAKDDKIVHVVKSNGRVSTSTDGGRTFEDYVKSQVYATNMIVAPNGDILIVGMEILVSPAKINVALSTDDGATWSRMAESTGLEKSDNPLLVAVDTDYATNNLIYIAH